MIEIKLKLQLVDVMTRFDGECIVTLSENGEHPRAEDDWLMFRDDNRVADYKRGDCFEVIIRRS